VLKTRITEKFGLKFPVMSAPMSLHSGGELAGAVTQAGGLGLFGASSPKGGKWLRNQIELARARSDGRPFGLGFISHLIPAFPDLFDVAIDERVPVIAFSFSDPSPWVPRAKDAGATVICQIQSIESAAQAVAAGAWLGTAMLATPECVEVTDAYKNKIVGARSEQTTYTKVFDILDELAYGIPPWPDGIAARVIANDLEKQWRDKEEALRAGAQKVLPDYQQAQAKKDISKIALFAGESVDFVNEIRSVADVIEGIFREAEQILVSHL